MGKHAASRVDWRWNNGCVWTGESALGGVWSTLEGGLGQFSFVFAFGSEPREKLSHPYKYLMMTPFKEDRIEFGDVTTPVDAGMDISSGDPFRCFSRFAM